jgi:hypothetical protein
MKKLKFISATLIALLLFSIVGAFGSTIDPVAFFDSPVQFIIDNMSTDGLLIATFPYAAVPWSAGTPNMAGVTINVYFIPLEGFSAFPALPTSPSTAAEYHTLSGNITLNANCNVIKLYSTYKTGGLKSESEGDIDGRYFKLTPEFFHPGTKAEIINFASSCINTPGILFFEEEAGKYLVVGSPGHPVYLSPAFDTGKVGEGRKGTMFAGEAFSALMVTKFEGTLPLTAPAS